MEWPSKNVCQGGMMHPPKVQYSPETKQFLKVLMEESKLSMMQRKKMNYYLRTGESLPSLSSRSRSEMKSVRQPAVLIRPGSSKRRSHDTIVQSGVYERERFVPQHPKVDREKEKLRLQNKMAYGKDIEPVFKKQPKKLEDVEEVNRFDQLVQEIKDREDWLKEMEELGEGSKHKLVIEQQIQARVREMKRLKLAK